MLGCSRAVIVQRFSVLLCLPFSAPYARESRLLLWRLVVAIVGVGVFFACVLWHFPVASLFSSKSGVYDTERNPGNSPCVLLPLLRPLIALPSPLHFAESPVYFRCCAQGFKLCLVGSTGKCTSSLSSQKQKFPYEFNYEV